MRTIQGEEGFTLIELIVVVAIIGVLAAVGFATFSGLKETAEQRAVEASVSGFGKSILTVRLDAGWDQNSPFATSAEETAIYQKNNQEFLMRFYEAMVIEDGVAVGINDVDMSNIIYALRVGPYCTVGFFGNQRLSELLTSDEGIMAHIDGGNLSSESDFRWAAFSLHADNMGLVDKDNFYEECPSD